MPTFIPSEARRPDLHRLGINQDTSGVAGDRASGDPI